MRPHSVNKSLLLSLQVIALLGALSFMPSFRLGGFEFKKIDLLSAIRADDPVSEIPLAVADTANVVVPLSKNAEEKIAFEKPVDCEPGLTCIEDFSPDGSGIDKFLRALSSMGEQRQPVRIAFYGDSFIEGDVFCGGVRDTLQSVFGGRGVGYVPITSRITGFRNTIKHDFDNWETFSIVSKRDSSEKISMGPAGYCFRPRQDNFVEYRVSKQRFLREFAQMRLFYTNAGNASVYYTVNDSIYGIDPLEKTRRITEWKIENRDAKEIRFEFENIDSLQLYGASFEDREGVYVDNFAMRGNSGIGLAHIQDEMFRSFNKLRNYKLVILQYGLNVVNSDSSRYKWYADRMVTVIEKMKAAFPSASIVLVSVSDRSTNIDGSYQTDEAIPALRNAQREIARRSQIAFWDLYSAMGGKNSMVEFVSASPALAAKDYTHLTFSGGRKLAGELVRSLLFEFEKYRKENKK